MLYTKGEQVKYETGGITIRAIVRARHRDGTATVEAQHIIDDKTGMSPSYLGYKYRLPISKLRYSL